MSGASLLDNKCILILATIFALCTGTNGMQENTGEGNLTFIFALCLVQVLLI